MNLRPITNKDQLELKKVYFDSIQSIDERIYTKNKNGLGQVKHGKIQTLKRQLFKAMDG